VGAWALTLTRAFLCHLTLHVLSWMVP